MVMFTSLAWRDQATVEGKSQKGSKAGKIKSHSLKRPQSCELWPHFQCVSICRDKEVSDFAATLS